MYRSRRSLAILVVVGAVLLVAALGTWQYQRITSPEAVFGRMISNAFSTSSAVKSSDINSPVQTVKQTTHLRTAPEARVHAQVEINQSGQGGSFVKRESLTTLNNSFVRLVDVKTTQKNSQGKNFDFSSILGIWAVNPADETTNSLSQLYGQNVAVPYAHLSPKDRQAMITQVWRDGVYKVDYSKVKTVTVNGREAYIYDVTVQPVAFIKMMKSIGQLVGVQDYAEVDPEAYKDFPEVKFILTVDVLSGDLIAADYGNEQTERYSGIGMRHIERDPKQSVTTAELQQRLQRLQQ